nr:helix-turn-helix domain-containing protein [Priestia endophytica]
MIKNSQVTDIFRVLQDPIRIRIIEMLRFDHERREFLPNTSEAKYGFCPMDILTILREEDINISNTKLSYHLKELRENHIVYLVKEGKRYFYLFNRDGLETILNWIKGVMKE